MKLIRHFTRLSNGVISARLAVAVLPLLQAFRACPMFTTWARAEAGSGNRRIRDKRGTTSPTAPSKLAASARWPYHYPIRMWSMSARGKHRSGIRPAPTVMAFTSRRMPARPGFIWASKPHVKSPGFASIRPIRTSFMLRLRATPGEPAKNAASTAQRTAAKPGN